MEESDEDSAAGVGEPVTIESATMFYNVGAYGVRTGAFGPVTDDTTCAQILDRIAEN